MRVVQSLGATSALIETKHTYNDNADIMINNLQKAGFPLDDSNGVATIKCNYHKVTDSIQLN